MASTWPFSVPAKATWSWWLRIANGSNPRVAASLPGNYTYSDLRWSPDDSKLGYQNGRTFDYDLSYVAAQGGKPQPITQDGNPLSGFAWLPDGSGVVYSQSRGDTVLYLP